MLYVLEAAKLQVFIVTAKRQHKKAVEAAFPATSTAVHERYSLQPAPSKRLPVNPSYRLIKPMEKPGLRL